MKNDYKFCVTLYPDTETYDFESVMQSLPLVFSEYAYCLHDKDSTAEGELKKAHVHVVGLRATSDGKPSPCSLTTISNALGVPGNYIEFCKSVKSSVRYLIHADDPEKFSYSRSEICGNLSVSKFFKDKQDDFNARMICDYILKERPSSVSDVADWALTSGCWAEFRRGFAVWSVMLREVNSDAF